MSLYLCSSCLTGSGVWHGGTAVISARRGPGDHSFSFPPSLSHHPSSLFPSLSLLITLSSSSPCPQVLCNHLPSLAPQLQSHCATELSACLEENNPVKLLKPLLKMVLKLVVTLRSKEEVYQRHPMFWGQPHELHTHPLRTHICIHTCTHTAVTPLGPHPPPLLPTPPHLPPLTRHRLERRVWKSSGGHQWWCHHSNQQAKEEIKTQEEKNQPRTMIVVTWAQILYTGNFKNYYIEWTKNI